MLASRDLIERPVWGTMKFIADLHVHSRFSRATARNLDPEHLGLWARKKGLAVIGTGDFTHPGWISEIQEKLVEAENGLYRLRPDIQKQVDSLAAPSCRGPTRFILSGEISCIYKKGDKTRKVHHLILMPDLASVERLRDRLGRIGNLASDGRPILGLDSRDLLELTLESSERAFFIPAHVWTPWFSVFGSKSGFSTLEECFGDLTGHIHALETGLSSDPPMNRRLSALDPYVLVSNSDAHSPAKLGREANIFETALDYGSMVQAMTHGQGFIGTVEFFPEEGKYHLDGHRKCKARFHPAQTREHGGVCPECGRPLTVGVLNRVDQLSDRVTPRLSKDFLSLIPLPEVLSELLGCGPATKKVTQVYERLLSDLGPELHILMDTPLKEIQQSGSPLLAEAVGRMRAKQVICEEGYDGEYGTIRLFNQGEIQSLAGQIALFTKAPAKPVSTRPRSAPRPKGLKKGPRAGEMPSLQPTDPILDPLNPEQKTAVLHQGGHLLVTAGPGTGKTLTLTHRIAYLIRSGLATPEQILALTFTRKAAREMAQRILDLIEGHKGRRIQISTFHGFCLDLLRRQGSRVGLLETFTLCSEKDAQGLLLEIVSESGKGERLASRLLRALLRLKAPEAVDLPSNPPDPDLVSLFEKYQHRLTDLGMLDLYDLEVEALRLLRDHGPVCGPQGKGFPWIFVDEYQDTNPAQAALLKALCPEGRSALFAIGDPDQAIYGFRGADVGNFHRFARDFPGAGEVVLARNYRSTKEILQASAALMSKAAPLDCASHGGLGPVALAPCRTEKEEAEMIVEHVERLIGGTSYFSLDTGRVDAHEGEAGLAFGDIGVLFRLNAQGDALEEAFGRAGIPIIRSGGAPITTQHPVNIVWRFLQTLEYPQNPFYRDQYASLVPQSPLLGQTLSWEKGPSLTEIVEQVLALHGLNEEETTEPLRRLKALAQDFNGDVRGFLDRLTLDRGIDHAVLAGDRVALMSLHAAKGLEWPVVFITGCEDRLLPCTLFGARDDEEERRLLYVGMTRARSRLILSHANRRTLNHRALSMNPSPFLQAMPPGVCTPLDRRPWKGKGNAHKQLELF